MLPKMAIGAAAVLALAVSLLPVLVDISILQKFPPSAPKLLFLGGLVELAIVLWSSYSAHAASSPYFGASSCTGDDVESRKAPNTCSVPLTDRHSNGDVKDSSKGFSRDVCNESDRPSNLLKGTKVQPAMAVDRQPSLMPPRALSGLWLMLLSSAVCSTVASNITFYVMSKAACYAWVQLAMLQVIALAVISTTSPMLSSTKGNTRRTTFSAAGKTSLWLLFVSICIGQGILWGRPEGLAAMEADALNSVPATVAPTTPAMQIMAWAVLAAISHSCADHLLSMARHISFQSQEAKQHLDVVRIAAFVCCNWLWFVISDGQYSAFWEEFLPIHWHIVLVLALVSRLNLCIISQPVAEQIIIKAYAYQAAAVLAAWGSSLLLQSPQSSIFACSSGLSGAAVLLLHNSMLQHNSTQGRNSKGSNQQGAFTWALMLKFLKRRQITWQVARKVLSWLWVGVAALCLMTSAVLQLQFRVAQHNTLAVTHPQSALAMKMLGITPALLRASTPAPFPGPQLYASTVSARSLLASGAAVGQFPQAGEMNSSSPAGQDLSVAAMASAAGAWDLCPEMTCSRAPSCKPSDRSCCVHLLAHMLVVWDAFLHSHALADQHLLLYDTLKDAVMSMQTHPTAHTLHVGVSAAALLALETPCIKEELWRRGYAMFLQGHQWHLCAHRQHPLHVFKRHMHPTRNMVPAAANLSMTLHVLWPHQQLAVPSQPVDLQLRGKQLIDAAAGQVQGERKWWICPTGEQLSTSADNTMHLNGLPLPAPHEPLQHLSSSAGGQPKSAGAASHQDVAQCQRLVAEVVSRLLF